MMSQLKTTAMYMGLLSEYVMLHSTMAQNRHAAIMGYMH